MTNRLTRGSRAAILALLVQGMGLAACASMAPPVFEGPRAEMMGCKALRGNERGLLIELSLGAQCPRDATIALFRDDLDLTAFDVEELGEIPTTAVLGDPGVIPGDRHHYVCEVWRGDRRISSSAFSVQAMRPPARPGRPTVSVGADEVLVSWEGVDGLYVDVWRRSLLSDSEPIQVSPALAAHTWRDEGVDPREVYAYSLRASSLVDGILWTSEPGPETYVEIGPPGVTSQPDRGPIQHCTGITRQAVRSPLNRDSIAETTHRWTVQASGRSDGV